MRLLMDVTELVAIFDEAHIHHTVASNLITQSNLKMATWALAQNAVVRVLNLPDQCSYVPAGFEAVRVQLAPLCKDTNHEFWPCDITLRDESKIDWGLVMGHNQITDS